MRWLPGTSVSGNVYMRKYRNIHGTINTVVPQSAFFPRDVADPRGNGEVITIYDILPQWLGQLNQNLQTVSSDINSRSYVGYDILLNSRLKNGATVNGGVSVGRFASNSCDVFNPNDQRFCDTSPYDIPWQPTYKVSGVYPMPYGIRLSGVFQSALFEYSDTYLVNRTVAPGLVQTSVTVQLDPPGSTFYPRANQLDIGHREDVPGRQGHDHADPRVLQSDELQHGPDLGRRRSDRICTMSTPTCSDDSSDRRSQ